MNTLVRIISDICDRFGLLNNVTLNRTFLSVGLSLFVILILPHTINARTIDDFVTTKGSKSAFTLAASGASAPLYISSDDFPGIMRVAQHLKQDIARVTGVEPKIITDILSIIS